MLVTLDIFSGVPNPTWSLSHQRYRSSSASNVNNSV